MQTFRKGSIILGNWGMPTIPAPESQRQENNELEASLGYTAK